MGNVAQLRLSAVRGGAPVTCRELIDFLLAYYEDELDPRVRDAFERHLALCRECREYVAAYERTLELVHLCKDDPGHDPAAAVPEALISAVMQARRAGA